MVSLATLLAEVTNPLQLSWELARAFGCEQVYDALSPGIRATVGYAHPLPIKRLVEFERAAVAAGASAQIEFRTDAVALASTTADGTMKLYAGTHGLIFSRGNGDDVTVPVVV